MAKSITTGTRSTQRTRLSYSTTVPSDQVLLQEALTAWAASWAASGDPFICRLRKIDDWCKSVLNAASIKYDPASGEPRPRLRNSDSRESYALQGLDKLHSLRKFLERGEARNAADVAFDLGALLSEASLKQLADRGFSDLEGRAKKTNRTQERNAEIRKTFQAKIDSGLNRKRALGELEEETGLADRQLRSILRLAR